MRLLLDAHVPGRVIARRLRDEGHDVRALSEEPELEGLDDLEVLELAALQRRILVTSDVADFPAHLASWGTEQRAHAGCILVYGIAHHELGVLLRGLDILFQRRRRQEAWTDVVEVLHRNLARP